MRKLLTTALALVSCANLTVHGGIGTAQQSTPIPSDKRGIEWMWSGAITSNSATIKAKLTIEARARVLLSKNPYFNDVIASELELPGRDFRNRVATFALRDLSPGTQYFYAVESGGSVDYTNIGKFTTFRDAPMSFTFVFGSCAYTGSNSPVFEVIRNLEPKFFIHMGDFHYEDIERDDQTLFRDAFDKALSSPSQSRLYQSLPIVYMWDDHDYNGDSSDRRSSSRLAARLSYQEHVPHYPLVAGEGDVPIYQHFSVGRVRFLITDLRSERDPESQTMLGSAQKAWLKRELLNAKETSAIIVWVSSVPWIAKDACAIELFGRCWARKDHWGAYPRERRELADFIFLNEIENIFMISGDAHMVAIDDGTNSNYSGLPDKTGKKGFPVMHAAALDQSGSVKGGPYSGGEHPGSGQFGLMSVTDDGGDSVTVKWEGWSQERGRLLCMEFVVSDKRLVQRAACK